eukprot:667407_1
MIHPSISIQRSIQTTITTPLTITNIANTFHANIGDSLMAQVLQKMDRLMEKQNMIEKQNMDQMQHVLNRLDEYAKTTSKQTTQLKQLIENDRNELAEALLANSIALQRQKLEQKQELQFMNYGAESGNDLCQSKNGLPPSRSFTFDWTANDETKPVPFANDSAPVCFPTFTSFRFKGKDTECDSLANPSYQTQSGIRMKHTKDALKELSFDDKKRIKSEQDTRNSKERMSQSFMWNKCENIGKKECGSRNTKALKPTSAALTFTSKTDNIEMDKHNIDVPNEAINVKDIWNSHYKSHHLEQTFMSLNVDASPFGSNTTTKENRALSSEASSEYKASALCGSTSECNPSDMESNTSAFTSEHPTTSGTTILNRKSIKQCVVDEH